MIEIRKIGLPEIPAVALIHLRAFPESAITQLGDEAVQRYYEWQLSPQHDSIALAAFEENIMVGFCFAGVFRGALHGFLNTNKQWLIRRILFNPTLLVNPLVRDKIGVALRSLYKRKRVEHSIPVNKNLASTFGVLSIATDASRQGKGIGNQLLEATEQYALDHSYSEMHLTVHPSNLRAVKFYEKSGWQRVMRSGEWGGLMTKKIGQSLTA